MGLSKQIERRHFVIIACFVLSFSSAGLNYGFCVMYADLIDVFSTSRLTSSFIQGNFNFFAIGAGILWTFPIQRVGLGLSIASGAVLACLGFFTSSLAQNSQTLIVCTGVIGGIGISIAQAGPFAVVGMLYKKNAGFPIALLTIAISTGQMTMPSIYRVLLEGYHWAGAFIILSGIALQGLPCGVFIHCSNDLVKKDDNGEKVALCDKGLCVDPVLWLFLVFIVVLYGTANFEMWFLVDQMLSIGQTKQFGTTLLSVIGLANLFGRIVGSLLKLKTSRHLSIYNMFYVCPLLAIGHTLMILLQPLDKWIFLACIVYGVAFGSLNTFTPVILYDLVASDRFSQAVSELYLAFGIGNMMCNFIGGNIRDMYGDYDFAYEVCVGVSVLATFGFMTIAYLMTKRDKAKTAFLQTYDSNVACYKSFD